MSFSDETLMAYADGELEPALAARVEEAMRADPRVEEAVRRHRALRADVFAAFAGVLDEPVPERLQPGAAPATATEPADQPASKPVSAPVADAGGATVHSLEARRAARQASAARPEPVRPRWGALAASLAVGVLAGALGWQAFDNTGQAPFGRRGGAMVAQGELADALSQRLAAEPAQADAVRLGVSFRDRDGAYCRSFMLGTTGGFACRQGGEWRIPVMAQAEHEQAGAYRQAGSALPAAVLDAIDQRIAGGTLDAPAERAARDRGWPGGK
jgi:anti-sigma factor RsiW